MTAIISNLPGEIGIPEWAVDRRPAWTYTGWIPRKPLISTFDELCKKELRSDHGEQRVVDIYPEGAVCWMKETTYGKC